MVLFSFGREKDTRNDREERTMRFFDVLLIASAIGCVSLKWAFFILGRWSGATFIDKVLFSFWIQLICQK